MGYDMYVENRTNDEPGSWGDNNTNPDYFRLNIGGMQMCVALMREYGMSVDDYDTPSFPKQEMSEEEYEKASDKVRRYRIAKPGIPEGKVFTTNDEWHVLPEEIRQALDAYAASKADKTQAPQWFGEWLKFLEHAEKQGGFRVH